MPLISLACTSTHMVPSVLADADGPKLAAGCPPSLLWPLDTTLRMHSPILTLPFQLCVSWTLISHLLSPSGPHLVLILPSLHVHYVAPRCPLFSLWPPSTLPWFHSFPLLPCTLLSTLAPGIHSPIIRIPGTTPFNFPPGHSGWFVFLQIFSVRPCLLYSPCPPSSSLGLVSSRSYHIHSWSGSCVFCFMHSLYYSIPFPRIMHMLIPLFQPDYPPNPPRLNIKKKKKKPLS